MTEPKPKHLEMIQSVISRMAQNSFYMKGWSVAIISALFVLASKTDKSTYFWFALVPTTAFWIMDGFFLWQERLFRRLYDAVRAKETKDIDFSMNNQEFMKDETWVFSAFSATLLIFHIPLFFVVMTIASKAS